VPQRAENSEKIRGEQGGAGPLQVTIDSGSKPVICRAVTRHEIEQKMDELAREYRDTHDPEIPEEIDRLARQLMEMDH
jgi:hypothetical protein